MPLAPAIAAALTTPAAGRKWILTIDGLDVIAQPGAAKGTGYGVAPESIDLKEAAAGQNSTLSFVIDDPSLAVTIPERAWIRFHDLVRDRPLFVGFVDRATAAYHGLGRQYTVDCVGIEQVLDWSVFPGVTGLTAPLTVGALVQWLIANSVGVGVPLRALMGSAGTASSRTSPIAGATSDDVVNGGAALDIAAGTLRQAIETVLGLGDDPEGYEVTVDFYQGVRVFYREIITAGGPGAEEFIINTIDSTDEDRLAIDTVATTQKGSAISFGRAYSEAAHQVFVQGGNAAGTGVVTDGTGLRGPTPILSDSTITTATMRDQAGRAFLAKRGQSVYAELDVDMLNGLFSPSNKEIRAYNHLRLLDATLGAPTNVYLPMRSIGKRFAASGEETWRVKAGARLSTGSELIRRITPAAI